MAESPRTDGAPKRSCLGCLTTSGLGCLAFLVGAGLAVALFGASLMGGAMQVRIQDQLSDRIAGSIEIGSLSASITSRQRAEGVLLRDPEGREVARVNVVMPPLTELFVNSKTPAHFQIEVVKARIDRNARGESDLLRALRPIAVEGNEQEEARPMTFDIRPFEDTTVVVRGAIPGGPDLILADFEGRVDWTVDSGAAVHFEGDLRTNEPGVTTSSRLKVDSSAPDARGVRTGYARMSNIARPWLETWLGDFDYLGQMTPDAVKIEVEFGLDSSGGQFVTATVDPSNVAHEGELHLEFGALLTGGHLVPRPDGTSRLNLSLPHSVLQSAARTVMPRRMAWSAAKDADLSIDLLDFDLPLAWNDVLDPLAILRDGTWSMRQNGELELEFQPATLGHTWDLKLKTATLQHDGDGVPTFRAGLHINKPGRSRAGSVTGRYIDGRPELETWDGPAAFADDLLGLQGYLSDMLGGDPQLYIEEPNLKGARSFRLEDGSQEIQGIALLDDVLILDGPSLQLDLPWGSPMAQDTLRIMLPFLDFVSPPTGGNLRLTVDALYLPLPYDLNTLEAQISIDTDDAVPAFTEEFRKLLVLDDPEGKMPRLEIVEIDIKDGEASYEFLELEIERSHLEWTGRLDLERREIDLNIDVPFFVIAEHNATVRMSGRLKFLKGLSQADLESIPDGLGYATLNLRGSRDLFQLSRLIGSGDEEIRGMAEIIDTILKGVESMTGAPGGG